MIPLQTQMAMQLNPEYYWYQVVPDKTHIRLYVALQAHPFDERLYVHTVIKVDDETGKAETTSGCVPRGLVLTWLDADGWPHIEMTKDQFILLYKTHECALVQKIQP